MIKLGGAVPVVERLGAASPCTRETFQVPSPLCVKMPKEIPFDISCMLYPGGVASRSACSQMIKALRQNEDFGHAVAPGTRDGRIVTAGTRICVGRGQAVEVPRKHKRRVGIRNGCAGSFRVRTSGPFLHCEFGIEKLGPELDQLRGRNGELLAVLQV